MKYKKWRELNIDPYTIPYKNIKLEKIINYLPAGNDVLECICLHNNKKEKLIIKIERSKMANFKAEKYNLLLLQQTEFKNLIPSIIEYGNINNKRYLILEKKEGRRLSEIINKRNNKKYLFEYGKSLAQIHNINTKNNTIAQQRVINDIPNKETYPNIDKKIIPIINNLNKTKPNINSNTFIHGDYHYANILWKYKKITGILDFEYSGMGFKEQDIAWALVLRPNQKFLDNIKDIKIFLDGYLTIGTYNKKYLKWCLLNACCHFYLMNQDNNNYKTKLLYLIEIIDKQL